MVFWRAVAFYEGAISRGHFFRVEFFVDVEEHILEVDDLFFFRGGLEKIGDLVLRLVRDSTRFRLENLALLLIDLVGVPVDS